MDLTKTQAKQLTMRIRKWVKEFPTEEVQQAYEGRVWKAMGYETWAQWSQGELGGFKLSVPQRKHVVAELSKRKMSNRAIAEVTGASEPTIRRDKATASNDAVEKTLGQDGKWRNPPKPKEVEQPPIINVLEAAQVSAEIQDEAEAIRNQSRILRDRMASLTKEYNYSGDQFVIQCLNEASDNCIEISTEIMQFTMERTS